MIPNVNTDERNRVFWTNNNAIATTGVNSCLTLVYFYTEQGCRKILMRHISAICCLPVKNLIEEIQQVIKSNGTIEGIAIFGLITKDEFSNAVLKEINDLVETNFGPVILHAVQTHLEIDKSFSHSTVLCQYEVCKETRLLSLRVKIFHLRQFF
jgi:hypothetical protein